MFVFLKGRIERDTCPQHVTLIRQWLLRIIGHALLKFHYIDFKKTKKNYTILLPLLLLTLATTYYLTIYLLLPTYLT